MGKIEGSSFTGENMRKQFAPKAFTLIFGAIVVNIVLEEIVRGLQLPLYFNLMATIVVALIAGPLIGILVGFLTNVCLYFMIDTLYLPLSLVSIISALCVGLLVRRGYLITLKGKILSLIITTLVVVLTSSFMAIILYGGESGNGGPWEIANIYSSASQRFIRSLLTMTFVPNLIEIALSFVVGHVAFTFLPRDWISLFTIESMEKESEKA